MTICPKSWWIGYTIGGIMWGLAVFSGIAYWLKVQEDKNIQAMMGCKEGEQLVIETVKHSIALKCVREKT